MAVEPIETIGLYILSPIPASIASASLPVFSGIVKVKVLRPLPV